MSVSSKRPRRITVIGGGRCSAAEARAAEAVGRLIAEAGAVLICGGLTGVMEAAARGARAAGGIVVGLLPGDDDAAASPEILIPLPTGMGEARNALVARAGEAVIAVGGELGTLSEIALALKAGLPVVGLGSWELDPKRSGGRRLIPAATPEAAVRLVFEMLEKK